MIGFENGNEEPEKVKQSDTKTRLLVKMAE